MNDRPEAPYKYLPHTYPFVMTDRITEYEEGSRIVCIKQVSISEGFFLGQSGEAPVMPWSLVMESMAQTSGLLLGTKSKGAFLTGLNRFSIHGAISAGDTVCLTAVSRGVIGPVHRFSVKAEVDGKAAIEGELILTEFDGAVI
jgi:3-hydroxymyristoyl/3-hydroxydecanoyl-(acyl carrier protein) dehydratase